MMRPMVYLRGVATLRLNQEACIGCGMCLSVCPHDVFVLRNGKVEIRGQDACMECGACAQNCPVTALSVKAGVGCATAVINATLGREKGACCCTVEEKEPPVCGIESFPGGSRTSCC
jgi:NAD-dependent dihydropyrimidine dehydrogenase PreA subunit